jgi:hypothetical protein
MAKFKVILERVETRLCVAQLGSGINCRRSAGRVRCCPRVSFTSDIGHTAESDHWDHELDIRAEWRPAAISNLCAYTAWQ